MWLYKDNYDNVYIGRNVKKIGVFYLIYVFYNIIIYVFFSYLFLFDIYD